MIDKNQLDREIALIDRELYCFDDYQLRENNKLVIFTNFVSIKKPAIKFDLTLELEDGYPTNGHVWVHLPTKYSLSTNFSHESSKIHESYTRISCNLNNWKPNIDISKGDGLHTIIKNITKVYGP